MLNIKKTRANKHHQHSSAKTTRQEQAVRQLKIVVAKSNPFIISGNEDTENEDTSELNLVNLVTNRIMPASVQRDILDVETRGNEAFVTHVKERVNGEKNMWDKMSKLKYLT